MNSNICGVRLLFLIIANDIRMKEQLKGFGVTPHESDGRRFLVDEFVGLGEDRFEHVMLCCKHCGSMFLEDR